MNPSQDRTAVYCCDLALSVLVMLLSNISLLIFCLPLIISLVDPTLTAFITCGPLQSLVSHVICNSCWGGGWVTIGEQIDTNWIRIALYELACEQQTYFRREATTENTPAVRRLHMNATNDIVR